ncbi:MAG TPA: hypothetical protein VIY27_12590 [Myxococcota bacterium]
MGRSHKEHRRRTLLLASCLALALAGGGSGPLAAEPAAKAPGARAAQDSASLPADLEQAAEALAAAEARSEAADAAYSRMRRSNRPRGAARDAIVRERIDAREALVAAREHYEALAGRAGTRH